MMARIPPAPLMFLNRAAGCGTLHPQEESRHCCGALGLVETHSLGIFGGGSTPVAKTQENKASLRDYETPSSSNKALLRPHFLGKCGIAGGWAP